MVDLTAPEAAAGHSGAEGVSRTYWDAAQVAPLHPAAREALGAALEDGWADPERLHREGRRARMLLDGAREAVAAQLGARTEEVAFTPSHTASVHAGVLGVLAARSSARVRRVALSAVEHSAVRAAAGWAAGAAQARTVAVDGLGRVDPDEFGAALAGNDIALAALQSANGEVATRQPVGLVHEACRAEQVPLLVDAAASAGHEPLPGYDLLTTDPRGWGAPPGVGVLVVRAGVRWRSPSPEDPAITGDRIGVPGAVAVPQALAAAVALQAVVAERETAGRVRRAAIDRLREGLSALPDVEVLGHPVDRLPHILTFSCLYASGEALVGELDRAGFAVGSGSACTASTLEPSHVLAAMGALTGGNVRIGIPATAPAAALEADCARFLAVLPGVLGRIRAALGADDL